MQAITPLNGQAFLGIIGVMLAVFFGASPAIAQNESESDYVGEISAANLLADYPVFREEYDRYKPSESELQQFAALVGKEVTALFATWCHDSERELPRFLKLLDVSKIELKSLRLIAVDRDKNEDEGIAESLGLGYTPTFIVEDGGLEIARVIETPEENLAADFFRQIAR